MNSCTQNSRKLIICIALALGYLGIFITYTKFPSRKKILSEDQIFPVNLPITVFKTKTQKFSFLKPPSPKTNAATTELEKTNSTNVTMSRMVDNFTKTSAPNVPVIETKIVLVVAYMRTGSSFMGGIFNHYPGTFYLFEPIRHIFETIQNNGNLWYLSGNKRRISRSDSSKEFLLQDIRSWLSCSLHEIDIHSLTDVFHTHFKDGLQNFYKCAVGYIETFEKLRNTENNEIAQNWTGVLMTRNLEAIKDCVEKAKQICVKAPLRVIKFIRLRMPFIEELLPLYPNLKVIYLQRDPRAILRSRVKTGLITSRKFQDNVNLHCNASTDDIESFKFLAKQYPGRFKLIRYEDVAESPVKVLQDVFDFCDLNFNKDMNDYVISLTSQGGADSCAFCVKRGNSKKTANKWRTGMTMDHVRYIDQQCSAVYKILGYKKVLQFSDLRNLSVPSRSNEPKISL